MIEINLAVVGLSFVALLAVYASDLCFRKRTGPALCRNVGSSLRRSRTTMIAAYEIPLLVLLSANLLPYAFPEIWQITESLTMEQIGAMFRWSLLMLFVFPLGAYGYVLLQFKNVGPSQEGLATTRNFEEALYLAWEDQESFQKIMLLAFESFEAREEPNHRQRRMALVRGDYERSKESLLGHDDPVANAFRQALDRWRSSLR